MRPAGREFNMSDVNNNNSDWTVGLLLCKDVKCIQFYCDVLRLRKNDGRKRSGLVGRNIENSVRIRLEKKKNR